MFSVQEGYSIAKRGRPQPKHTGHTHSMRSQRFVFTILFTILMSRCMFCVCVFMDAIEPSCVARRRPDAPYSHAFPSSDQRTPWIDLVWMRILIAAGAVVILPAVALLFREKEKQRYRRPKKRTVNR